MHKSRKEKLFITDGTVVGRLTVGDLVRDISSHPLYEVTPLSYLRQGRLREVRCSCGQMRLIAESILATGRLQSCGCLRDEIRLRAQAEGVKNLQLKAEKARIGYEIKILQAELRMERSRDSTVRNEKKCDELASKLRSLFAQRGTLNRKQTHKETWRQVTRERLMDKLLEDPEADTD